MSCLEEFCGTKTIFVWVLKDDCVKELSFSGGDKFCHAKSNLCANQPGLSKKGFHTNAFAALELCLGPVLTLCSNLGFSCAPFCILYNAMMAVLFFYPSCHYHHPPVWLENEVENMQEQQTRWVWGGLDEYCSQWGSQSSCKTKEGFYSTLLKETNVLRSDAWSDFSAGVLYQKRSTED